jgi:CDP-diacylglycerol--glycerol-3-phosphate 3-phosphatidyltransferase
MSFSYLCQQAQDVAQKLIAGSNFMTPRVERTTIPLLFAGVIGIMTAAMSLRSYGRPETWTFIACVTTVWGYAIGSFARLWREHSTDAEISAAPITAATCVTLARAFLISLVSGYAFDTPVVLSWRPGDLAPADGALWVPAALYALAAIADRADGALARRTARVTALGARLDVTIDALGLLVAPLVGVRWGRLPPWYLVLALAYPAFRVGLRWRRARRLPTFPERLKPDPRARFFAGVQMTVVAAALFPVLPAALTWTVATAAMLPTLFLFAGEWRLVTASVPDRGARAESLHA